MERLLAYNSSSDEESGRTTKDEQNLMKREVKLPGTDQGKDQEIKDVCATESCIQTYNNQMGPFLEARNAFGLNECSYSKSKQTSMRNDHGSIVLQRTFSEPQFPMSFSNQEKKSPAFNSSLTQYKHSNSSSISGRRVKPYVSKREREKLAQTALPGSSSSSLKRQLHVALEKSNFDHTINEVDLQPNRPCEISDGKHLARACQPPKQLHLNFEGHSQGVNCVHWNPTRGNLLLSAAMDHLVCVWDTSCGSTCCRRLTHHTAAVKDSKWSLCGEKILSCGYDKTAKLSNLETGQEIIKFPHKNFATCVQFHPTDPALFLSGTFKSAILCWDTRTGNITSTYSALFGQVQDIAFLPGGDEFVSAAEVVKRNSTDKGIMVWDFRSTAVLSNQIYQEAFTCTCLKVHPHEAHFVAQSNGDYIALFSTRKPYKLNKFKRYEGHKVSGYHIGCDFSPDGSIITSGSADGQIYFYDHHTSHMVRTLQAHSLPCMDVAFHPTLPNCVASCGWEGQVKVWK